MLGETMARGSALLRTGPVCHISLLHPALLGAAAPELTTESTDKTAQNPVIPEKGSYAHARAHLQIQTDTLACKHSVTWACTRNTHRRMHAKSKWTGRVQDLPPPPKKTATIKPRGTQMCSDTGVGNALSCAKAQQLTQKCWCRVWGCKGGVGRGGRSCAMQCGRKLN